MAVILVVDDEKKMRHLLRIMLERRSYEVLEAGDGIEAFRLIKSESPDIVITDMKMPKLDGLGLLRKIIGDNLPIPVVFITAFATIESAVDAMREGAVDYITKPFDEERIILTVERTLNFSRIMAENVALKKELRKAAGDEEIIYVSEKMARVMDLCTRVAESESAVLISGESGTGKELLARFIHKASPRSNGRFVPVNCAAISPGLVESELFGHEKGAFTGAERKASGKFEFASEGTLFLDEIGDLPLEAQAKMLRALQEKKIQRVGKNEEIPVDVRVICATNRNLEKNVDDGEFRQDLFFRINVFPIQPPPLRERREDIMPLARHFLKRLSGGTEIRLEKEAEEILCAYDWPGNVRELANAMERSFILAKDSGKIDSRILFFLEKTNVCGNNGGDFKLPPEGIILEELEKDLVRQALDLTGNNQSAAAKMLGLTRAKFRVLLKQI